MSHEFSDVNDAAVEMNGGDQAEGAAADIEHKNLASIWKRYLIGGSESLFNIRKCFPRGTAHRGAPMARLAAFAINYSLYDVMITFIQYVI